MPEIDEGTLGPVRSGSLEETDRRDEPALFDLVSEYARSVSRWYGIFFMAVVLVYGALGVWCAVRFLKADNAPDLVRWGVGIVLCWTAVIGAKIWFYLLLDRMALTRELRRAQRIAARMAERLEGRPG
jgi:prolipoprotein diacylglyceryltransferase